jgi:leucyl-tRNA synthetase
LITNYISIRIEHDARLGRKLVLLDALYGCTAKKFAKQRSLAYWEGVDLYIGGNRTRNWTFIVLSFWNKFLKDKGFALTKNHSKN